jgi:hypothetical protein
MTSKANNLPDRLLYLLRIQHSDFSIFANGDNQITEASEAVARALCGTKTRQITLFYYAQLLLHIVDVQKTNLLKAVRDSFLFSILLWFFSQVPILV